MKFLESLNSRFKLLEEIISQLGNRLIKFVPSEEQIVKIIKKSAKNFREMWKIHKHINICVMELLQWKKTKKWSETMFEEIMAETSQIWWKALMNKGKETKEREGRKE